MSQQKLKKSFSSYGHYGEQLQLQEITLVLFVEKVDDANRQKYEVLYTEAQTGVKVHPIFVETQEA